MNNLFNEFGTPCESINYATNKIHEIVRNFFRQLRDVGYTPLHDFHAVGNVFTQTVGVAVAEALMEAAYDKRQQTKRNADPNLNEEEIAWAKEGNKIQAIKNYRQRTANGLKESKDVIEAWMLANLGTKNPAYVPATCSSCSRNPAADRHSCPYAEDINDNHDPEFCNCCSECRHNCADDI